MKKMILTITCLYLCTLYPMLKSIHAPRPIFTKPQLVTSKKRIFSHKLPTSLGSFFQEIERNNKNGAEEIFEKIRKEYPYALLQKELRVKQQEIINQYVHRKNIFDQQHSLLSGLLFELQLSQVLQRNDDNPLVEKKEKKDNSEECLRELFFER